MAGAALVGGFIVLAGIGVLSGVVDGGSGGRIGGAGLIVAGVLGAWRFGFHPALRLDAEVVTVTNPWRTVVVPLSQVGRTSTASYSGVTIDYLDGDRMRRVTAWAVQKANLSQLFKKSTRADTVAAAIDAAVSQARGRRSA